MTSLMSHRIIVSVLLVLIRDGLSVYKSLCWRSAVFPIFTVCVRLWPSTSLDEGSCFRLSCAPYYDIGVSAACQSSPYFRGQGWSSAEGTVQPLGLGLVMAAHTESDTYFEGAGFAASALGAAMHAVQSAAANVADLPSFPELFAGGLAVLRELQGVIDLPQVLPCRNGLTEDVQRKNRMKECKIRKAE